MPVDFKMSVVGFKMPVPVVGFKMPVVGFKNPFFFFFTESEKFPAETQFCFYSCSSFFYVVGFDDCSVVGFLSAVICIV